MLPRNKLAGAVVAAALALAPATAALAAPDPDAPRLWSFWTSDGLAWLAPDNPAAELQPADGAVIGWRFGVAPEGTDTDSPREVPVFDKVCGKQAVADGQKRVVLAVDFGDTEVDAYPGDKPPASTVTCVVAPFGATSLELLSSDATRPRVDAKGAVVAVSGYPAKAASTGQGLPSAPAASTAAPESGLPMPLIAGGAGVVALLGAGAVVIARRRKA